MLEPGSVIGGRLRIDRVLGEGGMGVVAAATHLELGHRVAVKVLHDDLAQNPTIVGRFIREARSAVNLRTEHVCRVFDVGRLDTGAPYIVMELLDGTDLARAVAKRPLPVTTAVDYILQACVALTEAHAAGIIHRDIKPANLFVTRRLDGGPLVKVLDFGIAKATEVGPELTHGTATMGSPGYMSPEQLQSAREVDTRTDIWALGVTLYELIAARMPFAAGTQAQIAIKVAADPPAPLDCDPGLRAVIFRCLEKDREHRYETVGALAADLRQFGSQDGLRSATLITQLARGSQPGAPAPLVAMGAPTAVSVVSDSPPVPTPDRDLGGAPVAVHRPRWPWIVALLGGLAMVGAVVLVLSHREPATTNRLVVAPSPRADAAAPATDGGDPWGAAPDDAEPDEPEIELPDLAGMAPGIDAVMLGTAKQMKESCKEVIKQANASAMFRAMPAAQLGLLTCHCILGDRAKAQAAYDALSDPEMRKDGLAACKGYGVALKKQRAPATP